MSNIDVNVLAQSAPRVCFVTLGCAKNEVDTAEMTKRLTAAGYEVCDDASTADVVVVNTCSFIQAATEESLEAIFEVCDLPNFIEGSAKLVVAGCMPARYGDDLASELGEAQAFVPCSKEDDIVEVLAGVLGDAAPQASMSPDAQSPWAGSPQMAAIASARSALFRTFAVAITASRLKRYALQSLNALRRACAKLRLSLKIRAAGVKISMSLPIPPRFLQRLPTSSLKHGSVLCILSRRA